MLKLWLKKPKLNYSESVVDIVQYGSSVIGGNQPNDIDIAVIFKKIPVKNQLNESQEIKKQLAGISPLPIHIKSFDFYSLFDKSNFAQEGILFYGRSLLNQDYFSKILHSSAILNSLSHRSNLPYFEGLRFLVATAQH